MALLVAPALPAQPAAHRSTLSVEALVSAGVRSVQPGERLDGGLRGIALQATHPLGSWAGLDWHYVVVVVPFMHTQLGASEERLRLIGPGLRSLYASREGVGAGIAPLGIQLSRAVGARTRAALEMSGGGSHYTTIVPYGDDGTRTNFTFDARLLLERRGASRHAVAVGSGVYHISNGGFGRANPGINALMLFVRWTRVATPPAP